MMMARERMDARGKYGNMRWVVADCLLALFLASWPAKVIW